MLFRSNLAKGQGFTQVRPLLIEVKTYFLLLCYCFILGLDYRVPTPLVQESATSLWCARVSISLGKAYRSKVHGPPYIGGRVPGLTTCTESQLDTDSYSRSCPSKLELRIALGLLSSGSLLHTGLGRLVSSPAHVT